MTTSIFARVPRFAVVLAAALALTACGKPGDRGAASTASGAGTAMGPASGASAPP